MISSSFVNGTTAVIPASDPSSKLENLIFEINESAEKTVSSFLDMY